MNGQWEKDGAGQRRKHRIATSLRVILLCYHQCEKKAPTTYHPVRQQPCRQTKVRVGAPVLFPAPVRGVREVARPTEQNPRGSDHERNPFVPGGHAHFHAHTPADIPENGAGSVKEVGTERTSGGDLAPPSDRRAVVEWKCDHSRAVCLVLDERDARAANAMPVVASATHSETGAVRSRWSNAAGVCCGGHTRSILHSRYYAIMTAACNDWMVQR